jgi:hypothetical protein
LPFSFTSEIFYLPFGRGKDARVERADKYNTNHYGSQRPRKKIALKKPNGAIPFG